MQATARINLSIVQPVNRHDPVMVLVAGISELTSLATRVSDVPLLKGGH